MNTAEHLAGEPAISVIVPIYNVEPYLGECLDSLCGQTLRNIEIIGVDDGSTDGSGALLDEYAAKNKRIIAVHQKNAGVSAARNAGMRLAKGEYLAFVDGDDWMERTAYEDILQKLQGRRPDIVIFRHTSIYGGELRPTRPYGNIGNPQGFCALAEEFAVVVWNKLYKKQFIEENLCSFTVGVSIGEDSLFNLCCFAASPLCTIIDSSYYFYRQLRLGATASTPISTKQVFLMKSALEASDFYKQLSLIERFAADIVVCRSCLYRFQILSEQQRRTEISYLSQLWSDMKNRYPADMLNKNKSLIQLSDLIRHKGKEMSMLPFRQKIFSIKNSRDKRHKIVRVLGLELKFERKKCRTEADACQA